LEVLMAEAAEYEYETPKVLATYEAADILAEAETGSVILIVE
jgi:hypothetical protein